MSRGKMKHVTHIISSLADGGAERNLYRLCSNSRAWNHTVIVFMGEGKYFSELESVGIKVHCLNMSKGRITLKGVIRLWKLIIAIKPDVVQTWMYHADLVGGIVSRLCRVGKIVWGVRHNNLTQGNISTKTWWIAKACAICSWIIPDLIISCSYDSVKTHVQFGYRQEKMTVISNGCEPSIFDIDTNSRENIRNKLSINDNVFLIGMVGRFDIQKDHANLIAALSNLKRRGLNFKCILIGTGIELSNSKLSDLINSENLSSHVLLLGQQADVPAYMNSLDIHVLSSLGEGFPNVIAEAMLCGVPCVATDVGDASYIIGSQGWVVPSRDHEALANKIIIAHRAWLEDPLSWGKRKSDVREQIVNNFSVEKMVGKYESAWSEH